MKIKNQEKNLRFYQHKGSLMNSIIVNIPRGYQQNFLFHHEINTFASILLYFSTRNR